MKKQKKITLNIKFNVVSIKIIVEKKHTQKIYIKGYNSFEWNEGKNLINKFGNFEIYYLMK